MRKEIRVAFYLKKCYNFVFSSILKAEKNA